MSDKIALAIALYALAAGLRAAWWLGAHAAEQFMIVNTQDAPFPARLRDRRIARRQIRLGHHIRLTEHPEFTGTVIARFRDQVVVAAPWRPGEVSLLWDFEVERTRTFRQVISRVSPWTARNQPVPFDLTADGALAVMDEVPVMFPAHDEMAS